MNNKYLVLNVCLRAWVCVSVLAVAVFQLYKYILAVAKFCLVILDSVSCVLCFHFAVICLLVFFFSIIFLVSFGYQLLQPGDFVISVLTSCFSDCIDHKNRIFCVAESTATQVTDS